ncbi:glycosyl hydrolase [Dendryphion nanum]|uniref:Arabinan endo-1,5-alpha-L-arabinosidase n=1 Tax=Dendryphion nanum TaxID=256645 RepID=A0A9P9IRN4_9PLEO|nr:glycosyl hydrolase [Dendryphion nanum]
MSWLLHHSSDSLRRLIAILSTTFLTLGIGLASPITPYTFNHSNSISNFPNPEPCTGNCTWVHDPSIIKKDNTYYRFSTSGNIALATAPSISGPWEYRGAILSPDPKWRVHPLQDVWAPDISKVNSTYYLYYSLSYMGFQSSGIGVATSPTMDLHSWTDHGSMAFPLSPTYNLIDPHLFTDPDDANSPYYFTFGSFWDDIFLTELPRSLLTAKAKNSNELSLVNIVRNSTEKAAVAEGAFTWKYDEYFYTFFSSGWCCNTPPDLAPTGHEYKIMVCRAEKAKGPYVDEAGRDCEKESGGTLVLGSHGDVYAPGGQGVMVLDEEEGRPVIYYHYVRPSVGYEAEQFLFGWNYLSFETGWPVVVEK